MSIPHTLCFCTPVQAWLTKHKMAAKNYCSNFDNITADFEGFEERVRRKNGTMKGKRRRVQKVSPEKGSPPSPSLEDNSPSSSTSQENVVTNGGIRCTPLSTLLANTSPSPKRKKKVVTLNQKLQIIKKLDEGASLKELATEYNLGVLTICKIYKKKDTINPVVSKWGRNDTTMQRQPDKSSKFSDLDKVMLEWLQEVREVKKPLKYSHILARAKYFYKATTGSMEGFSSSKGWWRQFRRQNGLHKGAFVNFGVTEYNCNKTELKEKPIPKASEESDTKSAQIGDQFVSPKLDRKMAQIKYTTAVNCIKKVISYLKQDTNTPYSLIQDAQSIYDHIMSQCKLKKQRKRGGVVANGYQWPTSDIDVTTGPSQKSSNFDTDSPALRPRQRKRISADKSLTSWSCTISGPPSNSIRLRLKGPAEDKISEGKHRCSECEATFDEAAQLEYHIVTHFTKQESVPCVNRNAKRGDRKVNFNGRKKKQKNRCNGTVFKSPLSPVTRLSVSGSYKVEDMEFDLEEECQDVCHTTLPKKRRHRCLYCAKIFPKSAHLASHLRTHANKHFPCDVCGIAFNELHDLKKHCEEVHAILDSPGEKPFKCMLCERLFKKKCHLIWHIQNHSFSSPVKVETPFKCDLCNRAFKLKCNLMWHQRTHKELVEEKVKVCEPLPVFPVDVKGNPETELDNFPFRCQVCKRTFRKNCNLKMHEKAHSHSSLSADVHVKCEDSDSLCDGVVDDSMGLSSGHSDGPDNLVKGNGGQKDERVVSLASNTEQKLSKRKLNTSGKDDSDLTEVVYGVGRGSRPNCSRRRKAEMCEKSSNLRGRRRTIKSETVNNINITEDKLPNQTDEQTTMNDDITNPTDVQNCRKDAQNLTNDMPSFTENTQNLTERTQNSTESTHSLAEDTLNLANEIQKLTLDSENMIEDAQNQTRDTQDLNDTQNLIINDLTNYTQNLSKDLQNWPNDTQDLTKDTQNLPKDTLKLNADIQNLTTDSQSFTVDSVILTESTQNLTKLIQNMITDTQNLTRDTQNLTGDTQNLTEGTQNLAESIQNQTENYHNHIESTQNHTGNTQNHTGNTQNQTGNTQDQTGNTQNHTENTQSHPENNQNQAEDTHNQTENTQNQTENSQIQIESSKNQTKNSQNQTGISHNQTENTQNQTENSQNQTENTHSQTENTHSQTENTHNQNENIHNQTENPPNQTENPPNQTENTQNQTENTQNQTENTQNQTENTQKQNENVQNQTENAQNQSENTLNLTENTQNQTENIQNQTESTTNQTENIPNQTQNTKTLIKDETVNLSDIPDIKNMKVDDTSKVTKTENPEMDEPLEPGIELPFRCKFCERSFKKNCNLKWHEKCHSRKRLKRSSYWDDSFSEGDDIDDVEVQSDLLPFKCHECNRAFKMNCHLKRHQKTHVQESDEEPEIVDEDEINFVQRSARRRSGIRRSVRRRVVNCYDFDSDSLNELDFDRPNTYRPKVKQLRTNTPNMSSPEVNKLDEDGHDVDRPDIERPDVRTSVVRRPKRNIHKARPFINRPFIDRPNIGKPDENRSQVNMPDQNSPDLDSTNINRSNTNTQSINTPTITRPNIDVQTPSVNQPGINQPNVNTPDIERHSVNSPNIDSISISSDGQQDSVMLPGEGEDSCFSPEDIESLIKKEIEDNIEEYDAYIDSIVKVEHDVTFDVMIKEEPDDTFELECY